MRITNQMINESAKKAGIPIQGNSLLDYINKNDTGSLLDSINNSNDFRQSVSSAQKSSCDKLEKAAKAYEKQAESMTKTGEDSIWAKAAETGDLSVVHENVKNLVEKYNSTLKAMTKTTDSLNAYYMQMFMQGASEKSKELETVGIKVQKDGTLQLEEDKMKEASLESLQKVLGADSIFVTRTGYVAARAADHAKTSAESLTSRYGADGTIYTAKTSQYDFMG